METYDVKTLYTNIPHEDLLIQLDFLFQQIQQLNAHKALMIGRKGQCYKLLYGNRVDWAQSRWDQLHSLSDLKNMIKFMVNHTYITLADKCFQQLVGIPMGTNSGVNIVDFYLVKYELDFMVQLLDMKQWELLSAFKDTMRYLDDILSIDNAYFQQLLYNDTYLHDVKGIYPRQAVTLQRVDKNVKINYMDTTIGRYQANTKHYLFNKLFTKAFDKRSEGKFQTFKLIKYPSALSLIRESVGYNIIVTQCHRFINLDMCKEDFVRDTIHVYHELYRKGFNKSMLISKVGRFLATYKFKSFIRI